MPAAIAISTVASARTIPSASRAETGAESSLAGESRQLQLGRLPALRLAIARDSVALSRPAVR